MRKLRFVLLLAIITLGIVSTTMATPSHGFEVWYYDDGTYSNQVGYRTWQCHMNYIYQEGVRTDYYYAEDFDCEAPWGFACYYCSPSGCIQVC